MQYHFVLKFMPRRQSCSCELRYLQNYFFFVYILALRYNQPSQVLQNYQTKWITLLAYDIIQRLGKLYLKHFYMITRFIMQLWSFIHNKQIRLYFIALQIELHVFKKRSKLEFIYDNKNGYLKVQRIVFKHLR